MGLFGKIGKHIDPVVKKGADDARQGKSNAYVDSFQQRGQDAMKKKREDERPPKKR